MTTTQKVLDDKSNLEKKLFDEIRKGAREKHILLPLLTDVSENFEKGSNKFTYFQWGLAGDVTDTLENGNEHTDGGMPLYNIEVPCDQDKKTNFFDYDKGNYISGVDYPVGFFVTSGVKHARNMEIYVAGLLRAAANTDITCSGESPSGEVNSEITEAELEKLSVAMDDQNIPKEGRTLIVNSRQKHSLIRRMKLNDASVAGGQDELRNAKLGRLYGFDVYEGNSNILPVADANQALAFYNESAFWGLGINPQAQMELQDSKDRTYFGVRSRFGAVANNLPDADGNSQVKVWLVGKGEAGQGEGEGEGEG